MMHEFCAHCDVRKTSLFEINQQLGDQMANLRAENENLKSLLKYYESADVVDVVRCKDCKYAYIDCVHGDRVFCRNTETPWYNDYFEVFTKTTDFCSYGERRKEDAEIH